MFKPSKKQLAVGVVGILLLAGIIAISSYKPSSATGTATFNDLLNSNSQRKAEPEAVAVSGDSPYYALLATPVACHYDSAGKQSVAPMLVEAKQNPYNSNPMERFLNVYEKEVTAIGRLDLKREYNTSFAGNVKELSIQLAKFYWKKSDGALIIKQDQKGYNMGLVAMPFASYLDIPVLVTSDMESINPTLSSLGVKYTIVCGDLPGFGKVMKWGKVESCQDTMMKFIRDPKGLNSNVTYITAANPIDIAYPKTVNHTAKSFSGELFHVYQPGPGAYPGLEESIKGVDFPWTIPADYKYALMRLKVWYTPHQQDEVDGERIYCFVFFKNPATGKEEQKCYFGTCAGYKTPTEEVVNFDLPLINTPGEYRLHVEGRNTYNLGAGNLVAKKPVPFNMEVRVESYDSPVFPYMRGLSSLAPYITAYHKGLIMAKPDYALQWPGYMGCVDCGEPTTNPDSHAAANNQSIYIHKEMCRLLARLDGKDDKYAVSNEGRNAMAEKYYTNPVSLAIVADANMIPHYYFPGGADYEGYGEPSDAFYTDINVDYNDTTKDLAPGKIEANSVDAELPSGRIVGWDVMDTSALMARTIFYYDILDKFMVHQRDGDTAWKNNAYAFLGSKLPVETMYGTLVENMVGYYQQGGFQDIEHSSEELSDFKISNQYQWGSNYIMGGVHGNYYWYVPGARWNNIAGGTAYDITNTLTMNMGPSVMFLVSCITGRIDGLNATNAICMAYIHVGINAYIGATRTTYGTVDTTVDFDMHLEAEGAVLLSEYFTDYMMQNATTGMGLRDAKNAYLPADSPTGGIQADMAHTIWAHYILYGDPDFNPYEPANA